MKRIKQLVSGMIGVYLFFVFSAQAGNDRWPVMSKDQRVQAIESFRDSYEVMEAMREDGSSTEDIALHLAKKKTTSDKRGNKNIRGEDADLLLMGYQSGLNKVLSVEKSPVNLVFNNDNDYPRKYIGSSVFKENKDPDFSKKKSDEILNYYLGNSYRELNAIVEVVTKVIVINVEVDTPDQFEKLMATPRLIEVNHLGNPKPDNFISGEQ